MKKIVLPFCFIALISIGLLSMNKFPQKFDFSKPLNSEKSTPQEHQARYSDCISLKDVSNIEARDIDIPLEQKNILFDEVNAQLRKYSSSLDSTIKNLNTIEAHKFLHSEFQRSKKQISADSLSAIKVYYHRGIMSICHERDKMLNSISVGRVAKR